MLKTIPIHVPIEWTPPPLFYSLHPEEITFVIDTGTKFIQQSRQFVATLTQQEVRDKIKEETIELEQRLLVQKELTHQMELSLSTNYQKQIDKMREQTDQLRLQIAALENNNQIFIDSEIKKSTEKYSILLSEKDRQINKINETHDFIIKQTLKSTSHKGKDGEMQFEQLAHSTFCDFRGFQLMDKHTQSGAGDFHLQFEDFDLLVDAKNYKKKVPVEQRDKIKQDLAKNQHLSFAWLVSLNTSIEKFDRAPVMYEWINTKQCIVYVNHLMEHEDPRKLLRIIWFTCKELHRFTLDSHASNEEQLRNHTYSILEKIRNMRKTMREINTTLNSTRNMLQLIDDECKSILDGETEGLVESNYGLFDEWWSRTIQITDCGDDKLMSTDLWFKFKQDNKTAAKEMNVTTDKFRQFLKTKLPLSSIALKSKNANSAFEMSGIRWIL